MLHSKPPKHRVIEFTAAEMAAIRLVSKPYKIAAHQLGISEAAFKLRIKNARAKCGAASAVDLAVIATRSGILIDLPDNMLAMRCKQKTKAKRKSK